MLTNNISKSKLSGKNIGIYFGTFAPLHTGHQQQIYKCASLNDGVLLVVSGYDNDR
ncbi:adenylyltransferase/cytidyltransferase family protein, partial [Staphylococcus hominis]